MNKKWFQILIMVVLLTSCGREASKDVAYSFFVAGHAYGAPGVNNIGFHPPFEKQFDLINSYEKLSFGVLTGDFVKESSEQDWKEIDAEIDTLGKKIHFALGNHEYKNEELIKERFSTTYYSFIESGDLHIILDPNLDNWNISGEQLSFLKETLKTNRRKVDNVFVYFHQVLWWGKEGYSDIGVNSLEGRASDMNFWSEVVPLFSKLRQEVYMFAGDIGADNWSDDCSYRTYKNLHFIASGMGNIAGDNFLVINVMTDKKVNIDLIAITEEDIHAMGNIEDY